MLFNHMAGSRYPHRPEPPAPLPDTRDAAAVDRAGFTRADVEAAVNQLEDRPDVEVDDLDQLLLDRILRQSGSPLGRAIRDARDSRNLSQEALAERLRGLGYQITLSGLRGWERTGSIKARDLVGVARALEVEPGELLEALVEQRVA